MNYSRKMIYIIVAIAAILAVAGVVLYGLPASMSSHALYTYDWFAANVFANGVFSMGVFSSGIFSIGVFSAGIFSIGIFSFGPFSVGTFSCALAYCFMKDRAKKHEKTIQA